MKHSGVRRFKVRLWYAEGQVHLAVRDRGKGFDVALASAGPGLGLISMEERIKLVGGELFLKSEPHQGTGIHACVRLRPSPAASRTDVY